MNLEFQVLYRVGPDAEVRSVLAIAEAEDQLREQFEDSGLAIVAINPVRPIIDWNQPNFDRDEAAEFLRIKGGTLSVHKGNGTIPWSKPIGGGIYPRAWLERLISECANPAGKQAERAIKDAA